MNKDIFQKLLSSQTIIYVTPAFGSDLCTITSLKPNC